MRGRRRKFSCEVENTIQKIILLYVDEVEDKMTRSDAQITDICKSRCINTNEKYIERFRKRLGITASGNLERRSNDVNRQHDLDVIALSRMFGQGRGVTGQIANSTFKICDAERRDYAETEKAAELRKKREYDKYMKEAFWLHN